MKLAALCPGLFFFSIIFLSTTTLAEDWSDEKINTDGTSNVHNEEQVVVNPTNPQNLVSVWRDFRTGFRQVGYGYSFDGGETWTNPGLFEDVHYARDSDPALTVNAQGEFFAMLLAYTGDTNQPNGMLMYRSTDGGVTWEDRGFAVNGVPGVFEDKEFVACDRTGGPLHDRLYMVWDRFFETNIYCVSTGDAGDSWTSERRVSDDNGVQFPIPVVGADGTLYVAWTHYSPASIRFDRSTDGGLTFGSDVIVTSLDTATQTLNGGVDAHSHPAMDADISGGAHHGRLYLAYMDEVTNDTDIFVRYSDDHGASWTSPNRINDDGSGNGRDQFHPWITVDNTGVVSATWLDRRQDAANCAWHCFISQSFDGGVTWTSNQQVSSQASGWCGSAAEELATADQLQAEAIVQEGPARVRLPGELREIANGELLDLGEYTESIDQRQRRAGAIGEYIGIAAADGYAMPVWTDFRDGQQDVFGGADLDRPTAVDESEILFVSEVISLAPNPTPGATQISYEVSLDGWVDLEVYDVRGRSVRALVGRKLRAGRHTFAWDGTNQKGEPVSPGAYWIRMTTNGQEASRPVRVLP